MAADVKTSELGPGRRGLGRVTTDVREQGGHGRSGGPRVARTSGGLRASGDEGGTSGFSITLKYPCCTQVPLGALVAL